MRIGTVYAIGSISFIGENSQPLPLKADGKEVKLVLEEDEKIFYQNLKVGGEILCEEKPIEILFTGEGNIDIYLTNKRMILIKRQGISFPFPWFNEIQKISMEKAKQRYGGKDFCDIPLEEIAMVEKIKSNIWSIWIIIKNKKYRFTSSFPSAPLEKLLQSRLVKTEKKGILGRKLLLWYTNTDIKGMRWGRMNDLPMKTIAPTQPVNVEETIKKGKPLLGRIGVICMFAGVAILLPMILVIHLALRSNPVLLCSLIIFPWLLIIIGYYLLKKS